MSKHQPMLVTNSCRKNTCGSSRYFQARSASKWQRSVLKIIKSSSYCLQVVKHDVLLPLALSAPAKSWTATVCCRERILRALTRREAPQGPCWALHDRIKAATPSLVNGDPENWQGWFNQIHSLMPATASLIICYPVIKNKTLPAMLPHHHWTTSMLQFTPSRLEEGF